MKKLVLIDGNSLLNRAFYATPVFSTRSDMPTNAIFGFTKLIFKIINDLKPEYLIVAFDLKTPTFRHEIYTKYKASRKAMPEDLAVQVEPLKNLLRAMNIAMCSKEGYEADDIIGTLSNKFDVHSYIYTGDRDSFQLVDEKTDVYFTKRGVSDLQKLNFENFKEQIGLTPSQIIDLKSLMGDKSDEIPGVPGIGEKTALNMLAEYGSLDGVYQNIENFKGAVKEKLIANKELAYLSYKLATIDRHCELDIELENCKTPLKYNEDVKKLFIDFEFKSLLNIDIFEVNVKSEQEERAYPEIIQCSSYKQFKDVTVGEHSFSAILSEQSAEIYVDSKYLVLKPSDDLLGGLSFADYSDVLKSIFENKSNKVVLFGCKDIMHILAEYGINFNCDFEDVSIAKYLCDYETVNLSLKDLCEYYSYKSEYSAFAISELYSKYIEIIKKEQMLQLYKDIEKPLVKILFEMEREGVYVSLDILNKLSQKFLGLMEEYSQKIYSGCGCKFNVNSPSQLGDVLYNKLGIQEVKKRNGKFSTGAEVLEKLQEKYPIVDDILKFRMYQKLYSTYLEGFKPLIDKNGLVHTTFNQTVTTTGRLSSTNPNLQNIPVREDEGRELRKIFVPREGNVFIDADYSQIELRLLAHFSGCRELIEAYRNGIDIHTVTASQVFGVETDKVTAKMRREAKAVNFGIIYGISDFGLSRNLNIPVSTAKEYIEKYFASYSAVKEYMNFNVEFAKQNGYVVTLTGRRRTIPEIKSSNYNLRLFGERAAMNMPLQGSSADIIKIAMINVYNKLKENGLRTKLILQVHDELVLESPKEEVEIASKILKEEMENAVQLRVPLTVEVHTGKNWYEAK